MSDNVWTEHAGESAAGAESGLLWKDCPITDIEQNRGRGYYYDERFPGWITPGLFTITQATAGTVAQLTGIEGGAIRATSSATAGQGMNVVLGTAGSVLIGQNKNIWFEARVRLTTISTAPQFFVGLSTYSTAIITGGGTPVMATNDYIGFSNVNIGATGVTSNLNLHLRDNGGTASGISSVAALSDGTWVNLGFKVKTSASGVLKVTAYVNGVEVAYTLTAAITAAIPDTNYLALSLVAQSGGTVSPTVDVAWRKMYIENSGG